MTDETCGTCRFFRGSDIGECKRFPPSFDRTGGGANAFPYVRDHDWCGEYKPKPRKVAGLTAKEFNEWLDEDERLHGE